MRVRKWVFSCLSLLVLFFSTACSSGATEGDQVTIEFWTMQLSPTFDEYIKGVIADYEKQHPNVKVKWVDVPWESMEQKMLSAVTANKAPDVANLNPQFAAKLAELDALVNMDEAVPSEERAKYFEGVWKANSFDGKTFGIPWYLSTQVTMYNREMFKEAGLDPDKPPTNFEELAEVAEKIKEKTGKYAFMPAMDESHFMEYLVQMEVDLTTDDGKKAAFNTPAGKKAFQYWVDLYKRGLIPKNSITEGHGKAIDMYQAGEIAILPSGPQFLKIVKENAPKIAEVTASGPQITGDSGKMNVAVMNLVVPKQSKHQKEAVDFALFITNAENQLKFCKLTAILPSVKKAAEDPYFTKLPDNAEPIDEARIISASQLPKSEVLVPPLKGYDDLKKAMNEAMQSALLGKKSVDKALADAEKKWNEILAKP